MANQGAGRSNYRIDPASIVVAKGFGARRYSAVRVMWDSSREDDSLYADVTFDAQPIEHDTLMGLVAGLNKGTIPDRFA